MDFNKSKILLDKINGLFHSMSMDKQNIAAIEKDLMVNYVRQFYDAIKFEETPSNHPLERNKTTTVQPPQPPVQKTTYVQSEPVRKEPSPYIEPTPEPIQERYVQEKIEPTKPRIIQVPPGLLTDEPQVVSQPKPAPQPQRVEPIVEPVKDSGEMDALFYQKEASDLSEKLGELPIRDLHKSMGINERELTKQELFGGNEADFKLTLDTLNGFGSYEEAKRYLAAHAARKYNWTDDSIVKKARVFLRLVARKYK